MDISKSIYIGEKCTQYLKTSNIIFKKQNVCRIRTFWSNKIIVWNRKVIINVFSRTAAACKMIFEITITRTFVVTQDMERAIRGENINYDCLLFITKKKIFFSHSFFLLFSFLLSFLFIFTFFLYSSHLFVQDQLLLYSVNQFQLLL